MIDPQEYEIRILRAFGRHHQGQRIRVASDRRDWLIRHGFAEAVAKGEAKQKRAKQPPPTDDGLDLSS